MDTKIIEGLRAAVMAAHPNPADAATREPLLAALRAEEFWNVRAPQLTDEVLILRRLETPARRVAAAMDKQESPFVANIQTALAELDALRAKLAEGR
jgi:hypothetical protein